jgi:hypothetical protein
MKKIFFALLLIGSLVSMNAGAQQLKFYYYPKSNVYYDVTHRHYIYSNNGSWTTVTTLPSGVSVTRTRRVVIYNSGPEVWTQNAMHVKKYSHYPAGRAVGWKGRNPNRAKGKMKHRY